MKKIEKIKTPEKLPELDINSVKNSIICMIKHGDRLRE
jgi:hypothetical protein